MEKITKQQWLEFCKRKNGFQIFKDEKPVSQSYEIKRETYNNLNKVYGNPTIQFTNTKMANIIFNDKYSPIIFYDKNIIPFQSEKIYSFCCNKIGFEVPDYSIVWKADVLNVMLFDAFNIVEKIYYYYCNMKDIIAFEWKQGELFNIDKVS